MLRTRLVLSLLTVILTILASSVEASKQPLLHQDVLQTIVPITVSSDTAQAQCTTLDLFPGSVIQNTVGFVRATCPNNVGAIRFHATTSETPNFILSVGWDQLFIIVAGFQCSFNFLGSTGLIGANITSGGPVPFTSTPGSTSTLYAGGGQSYDYCLHYTNPSSNGILSFTISWTP